MELLNVKNLSTNFYTEEGTVYAVDDVSFTMKKGETIGIVGESGSGKSVTALSITQLIPMPPGKIVQGEILFEGVDLLKKSKKEMRDIRGGEISMIFQEPMTALNPVLTVGYQIMEPLRIHQNLSKSEAREKTLDILAKVGIPLPEKRIDDYPHQLSGGMRQRVMIAIALSCNPKLLICDEPTTALDVTIQAQILELIRKLKEDLGTSVIMITHDLGVVAQVTQKIVVMYAGKIVEMGSAKEILTDPFHPYTKALLASIPTAEKEGKRLHIIKGMVPSMSRLPQGCYYHPRCESCWELCKTREPILTDLGNGRKVRCLLYEGGKDNG